MKLKLSLSVLLFSALALANSTAQAQSFHECAGTFDSSSAHTKVVDTNCQSGEVVLDGNIPVAVPDQGAVLRVSWILDGSRSGGEDSVVVNHQGSQVIVSNFDGTELPSAVMTSRIVTGSDPYIVNTSDSGCQNDSHSSGIYLFPIGISWYYNPIGEPATLSLTRIGNGFSTWKNETNRCGISPKGNSLISVYKGITTSPEAMGGNPPTDQSLCTSTREIDGLNVIGWGHLPEGVVAATCLTAIPGGVKESDIRFSTDYNWFTQYASTGCTKAWDLGDIATHEIGHLIGLGHSTDGTDQVMNPYAYSCNSLNRKLAKGDLLSLYHFYGVN